MMEFWLSGILSHKHFSFFMMEFWLSGSLFTTFSLFHDGILAIRKPFHEPFSFSRWTSGYQEAFSRIFFFLMVESRLPRSPFHEIFSFSWWNLDYHGALSRIFLSHGGISAITEPFHEFFFHMVESRLSQSLFTNFSFSWWNLGYHGAFSRISLSHGGILKKDARCGGRLFSYISQSVFT
jgi:hypothetical protein